MRFVSGHKKQATSYKAACDCHNSKCDKSEFAGSPGSQIRLWLSVL